MFWGYTKKKKQDDQIFVVSFIAYSVAKIEFLIIFLSKLSLFFIFSFKFIL